MVCMYFCCLLQGDETRAVQSGDTGAAVGHRLVGHNKLTQVHADHVGEDFNTAKHLAVVDTDNAADHFGHDDHVTEVGLDTLGALSGGSVLLRLAQPGNQGLGLALKATGQATASTGRVHLDQLVHGEVEQGLELHTTVLKLLKGTLLLQGGDALFLGLVFFLFVSHCGGLVLLLH